MAKYQHFEELSVWQEAARLYNRVLDLLEKPGLPLTPRFRNQLDRAALSVSNNIAEGFERVTTNKLTAWTASIENSPVQGKRHLTGPLKAHREAAEAAWQFRLDFLRGLTPTHPLCNSPKAKAARGEAAEE